MAAKLTNAQKQYLAMLSKQALAQAVAAGTIIEDCGCGLGPDTSFRHNLVIAARGRHGLRCCSQDDYGYVKAHLLGLLSQEGWAVKAAVRQASNPLRVWSFKIEEKCQECGIPLSKANGICRQMTRGRGLQDVEEVATLRNVFFKLRFYEPK